MKENELAKFLSGFFCASTMVHLVVLLGGWLPLRFLGFVFNSSLWTITLLVSLSLTMAFAFLGWGATEGKRVSSSAFLIFLLAIFGATVYFLEDYKADSRAVLIETKEEFTVLEIQPEDSALNEKKTFAFSFGNGKDDAGEVLAVDKDDNIIVAGYFQGTIDLDPGTGILERTSLGGSINDNAVDIYLAKYAKGGRLIWGFSLGSVGADLPHSLKTDKEGNIYLTGYFGGQMDVDPNPEEKLINSGTGRDAFLVKYDKDGKLLWVRAFGNIETIPFSSSDTRFEEGMDLDIDEDGNVYLVGVFDGTVDLDDWDGNKTGDTFTADSRSTFLAKFDSYGKFLKAVSINGKGINQGQAVGVNKEGSVYVAGFFEDKMNFDKTSLSSAGSADAFLVKYDKNLNFILAKKWGGTGVDKVNIGAIDVDAEGNVYLAGDFGGTIYLDNYKLASKGSADAFFVKLDQEGKPLALKSVGGVYYDSAQKIKLDSAGNILISGHFRDSVDFDPGKGVNFLQAFSFGEATDAFLAKYSSQGDFIWARSFGGYVALADEIQTIYGLAADSEDNPIITGKFYDQIDFHSSEDLNLVSKGKGDAFLVKYNKEGEIE
ncbi:MAG: hypothetical protein WC410_03455 [Candidatus Paceibacterota bacterium]|jgi:hypothetical protein